MSAATILVTVKQRNQLMNLPIDDWIKNILYIYRVIFSCEEEIMPFSGKWMELEIMSVEIS